MQKYEAVFISDLHLHPEMPAITKRFEVFIQWAAKSTEAVYILGDFFHAWPGDEAIDTWSGYIADQLAWLSSQGISVYFMVGNRDFLLGQQFFQRAKLTELTEPSVIYLNKEPILLVHGDRYCTRDVAHQYLRRLTRNKWFKTFFIKLPYRMRVHLVARVRQHSQMNRYKPIDRMAVVESAVLSHLRQHRVSCVIHGHTHQPELVKHHDLYGEYQRFILSDWDETPLILCYNKSNEFKFELLEDCHGY